MRATESKLHWMILVVGVVLLGLMIIDRMDPMPVYTSQVAISSLTPGESLRVEYEVERRRTCLIDSHRTIIDAKKTRFEQPVLHTAIVPSKRDEYARLFRIDNEAAFGSAILRTTLVYRCNLFQWAWPLIIRLDDAHFTIIPPPPVLSAPAMPKTAIRAVRPSQRHRVHNATRPVVAMPLENADVENRP